MSKRNIENKEEQLNKKTSNKFSFKKITNIVNKFSSKLDELAGIEPKSNEDSHIDETKKQFIDKVDLNKNLESNNLKNNNLKNNNLKNNNLKNNNLKNNNLKNNNLESNKLNPIFLNNNNTFTKDNLKNNPINQEKTNNNNVINKKINKNNDNIKNNENIKNNDKNKNNVNIKNNENIKNDSNKSTDKDSKDSPLKNNILERIKNSKTVKGFDSVDVNEFNLHNGFKNPYEKTNGNGGSGGGQNHSGYNFDPNTNGLKRREISNLNSKLKAGCESFDIKNPMKFFKSRFIKNNGKSLDDENKSYIGGAIFGFVLIILIFSAYFFLVYSPFQEELSGAKIAKMNELNSFYKGPLALDSEVNSFKTEINNGETPEEVELIDILHPATDAWRRYHNRQINLIKDDFTRVMLKYTNGDSKNILMSVDEAKSMVEKNDATVLSNLEFEKPDTVVVPVLINRLQAGGGLIAVGSIVDVYFLSSDGYNGSSYNGANSSNTSSNSSGSISGSDEYPTISGSTVVAILRSKDSGVIDASYLKANNKINNNQTTTVETEQSFSTDIEEIIKSQAAGGFNEEFTSKLLNNYGLKLSNYERSANLAELDVQYIILLEVPRNNVQEVLNNMENLMITIPTNKAPIWIVSELKAAYSTNSTT